MKILSLTLITLFITISAFAQAAQPARDKGISIYLNPETIVAKANNPYVQRFLVSGPDEKTIVAWDKTAEGMIQQIKQQPTEYKANGIWLVYTDPGSYTDSDQEEKMKFESMTIQNGIPLFECRASELPDGWKQIT